MRTSVRYCREQRKFISSPGSTYHAASFCCRYDEILRDCAACSCHCSHTAWHCGFRRRQTRPWPPRSKRQVCRVSGNVILQSQGLTGVEQGQRCVHPPRLLLANSTTHGLYSAHVFPSLPDQETRCSRQHALWCRFVCYRSRQIMLAEPVSKLQ